MNIVCELIFNIFCVLIIIYFKKNQGVFRIIQEYLIDCLVLRDYDYNFLLLFSENFKNLILK